MKKREHFFFFGDTEDVETEEEDVASTVILAMKQIIIVCVKEEDYCRSVTTCFAILLWRLGEKTMNLTVPENQKKEYRLLVQQALL
ncbi:Protein CBG26521 [Caenorhabditis briggsae]|uniref:Protein CBG26521 n=1 Tax=Caenorhabditis briggsae TaxID=6238 RepID=B6IJ04_CAEBR|nr:Protein CBG26521 [Caenorhabditis briggsae]CAR99884.1 Protein CBG26521 [Caenorhabditis briggsae]